MKTMMHNIRYVGLAGEINFSKEPYMYQDTDLFNYNLEYDINYFPSGRGGKVKRFKQWPQVSTLTLGVINRVDVRELVADLERHFQVDINAKKPAKLYVNGSYTECYIVSSVKTFFNRFKGINFVTFDILRENPVWITEEEFVYQKTENDEETTEERALRIPTLVPFWITQEKGLRYLSNNSIGDTFVKITIFGPINNPTLYIGSNTYRVYEELLENERIEIDQRNKTIIKITSKGDRVNVFHLRDKEHSVFKPISERENIITQNDDFSYTIVLYHERNEPKWS